MMFMMSSKISVFDYIVFGVSLVVPVAIALFYSCVKKQKTTLSVFLGDRSLTALPISFSLAVSYLSAFTITGKTLFLDKFQCFLKFSVDLNEKRKQEIFLY